MQNSQRSNKCITTYYFLKVLQRAVPSVLPYERNPTWPYSRKLCCLYPRHIWTICSDPFLQPKCRSCWPLRFCSALQKAPQAAANQAWTGAINVNSCMNPHTSIYHLSLLPLSLSLSFALTHTNQHTHALTHTDSKNDLFKMLCAQLEINLQLCTQLCLVPTGMRGI